MTRFTNILAAVALATALLPIAANATTMTPLHQVQIVTHKALSGPIPEVQRVAARSRPGHRAERCDEPALSGLFRRLSQAAHPPNSPTHI